MPLADLPVSERLRLPGETAVAWAVFDADWYLAAYPEVADRLTDRSPAAALAWYLEHGQGLGHSPNILFDETWYRQTYPDAASAVRAGEAGSAFDSYCRGGFRNRSPHWLFDEAHYRWRYPDISNAALDRAELANGYDHYLRHGDFEQRIGHLFFNPRLYCEELEPAEAEQARNAGPFRHYLRRIRSRAPEPRTAAYFDPAWYVARYREVAKAIAAGTWLCALHHYLCNDTPTAFDPLPDFSEPFYLTHNADLAAAIGRGEVRNGYAHFLQHGIRELRAPAPDIDLHYYAAQEQVRLDLEQRLAPNAFWHWLRIGRRKGLHAALPPEETVTEGHARTLWRRRAQALLPLLTRNPLDFTCGTAPAVSVIMKVKDEFAQTLLTLATLRAAFPGEIELVLVDAGSSDESRHIGSYVRGARLLPLEMEVTLSAARNAGLYAVTADYVLLLRNDTELAPGALAAALARMRAEPNIGAICGRVIRSFGVLAEAGCIVWRDATILPYLRDADPLRPEATFRRGVDACSSDGLLLRAAPLQQLEGFRDAFAPGPYADADLCRRLAEAGYRVEFDPALTVYTHVSSPAPSEQMLLRERDAFRTLHSAWLEAQPVATPHAQIKARTNDPGQRVLFLEDTIPLRRIGSGFVRSNDLVRVMAALGCRVTVFPVNSSHFDPACIYAELPDTVEVMHDRNLDGLADFVRQRPDFYDTVWVARAHNLHRVRPLLAPLLQAANPPRLVLDSEAIAALRSAGQAALSGESAVDLDQAVSDEFASARECQHVVAVNQAEAAILRRNGFAQVSVIGHMGTPQPTRRPFERRAGMLFVGAIHAMDSPNYESLCWFVEQVLPLVEQALRWETRLTVVGHVAPGVSMDRFKTHPRVTLRGPVADLTQLYDSHRLFVAPTRFAAGLPYKVHEAACFGLPVVATTLLCGQLGWTPGEELLVAEATDPAGFAEQIVRLHRDPALWQRLRDAALARIAQDHQPEAFAAAVAQALGMVPEGQRKSG